MKALLLPGVLVNLPACGTQPAAKGRIVDTIFPGKTCYVQGKGLWSVSPDASIDLGDPATLGILLDLVRKKTGYPMAFVYPCLSNGTGKLWRWQVDSGDHDDHVLGWGETEGEALLSMLGAL